ncbi:MAG: hypothetical protein ABH831_00645 [Candidatus Nealsonbacteria bacterium]
MNKLVSSKIVALTFGALVIVFLAAFYAVAVWQDPSQGPPEGNVGAPLNVSNIPQTKEGPLTIANGGGDALILRNGGDLNIYNADNSGSALLYTDNDGELITPGNLKVGSVVLRGDSSISDNLNADRIDDYHAADLLAGGIVGGCAGGLCETPPVGYHIDYDWDGDLFTARGGDCDETCPLCYPKSQAVVSIPDGKDQDCDGIIDEAIDATLLKTCDSGDIQTDKKILDSACNVWCQDRERTGGTVNCEYTYYTSNPYIRQVTFSWDSCTLTSGGSNAWPGTWCVITDDPENWGGVYSATCYCTGSGTNYQ